MFSRAAAFTSARPEEILRQVNPWFILLTFVFGLLANIAPASGVTLLLRPDFLALVILYWCIQEPRLIGVGIAWCVGLVMDVADATLKIARAGKPGDTYHISGYELVSIRALVEMILKRLGKSFDDCVEMAPERPGKDTAYMLDSVKLRTELGWRDILSLEQGIDDVIRWAERFSGDMAKLPAKYEHKP